MLTITQRLSPLWAPFHEYAWAFPTHPTDQDRKNAIHLYTTIFTQLIFCDSCRDHYVEMLKRTPPDATSKTALFDWTIDRHNEVNERIGLPKQNPEVVRKAYETGNLPIRATNLKISKFFNDLEESLSFKERVMMVVVAMIVAILLLRRLLAKIANFVFCA